VLLVLVVPLAHLVLPDRPAAPERRAPRDRRG
jgi:hypothetical protein